MAAAQVLAEGTRDGTLSWPDMLAGVAMILFRPEHVEPILRRKKTQTRRMGDKRWNVGAVHQARTRMMDADSTFARLRIQAVRRELLMDITERDAVAEGYASSREYLIAFARINRMGLDVLPASLEVWVVEFGVEEAIVR